MAAIFRPKKGDTVRRKSDGVDVYVLATLYNIDVVHVDMVSVHDLHCDMKSFLFLDEI